MAKRMKLRNWTKAIDRATKALAANKARLDAASSAGLASDHALRQRAYDPDPSGGGTTVPRQITSPLFGGRKRRRRRRR